MAGKSMLSVRASDLTREQLGALASKWNVNQTEALTLVVDRAHRQEFPEQSILAGLLAEHVACAIADGLSEEEADAINAGDGWTFDVGDNQNWARHTGASLSPTWMAHAKRLAVLLNKR